MKKDEIIAKAEKPIERLMEIRDELEAEGFKGKAKSLDTIIDRLYKWSYTR
jgi:hypothetical protein